MASSSFHYTPSSVLLKENRAPESNEKKSKCWLCTKDRKACRPLDDEPKLCQWCRKMNYDECLQEEPVDYDRRKLAKVKKCDECRRRKIKCLPEGRIWPEQCENCEKQKLACSEPVLSARFRKRQKVVDEEMQTGVGGGGVPEMLPPTQVSLGVVLSQTQSINPIPKMSTDRHQYGGMMMGSNEDLTMAVACNTSTATDTIIETNEEEGADGVELIAQTLKEAEIEPRDPLSTHDGDESAIVSEHRDSTYSLSRLMVDTSTEKISKSDQSSKGSLPRDIPFLGFYDKVPVGPRKRQAGSSWGSSFRSLGSWYSSSISGFESVFFSTASRIKRDEISVAAKSPSTFAVSIPGENDRQLVDLDKLFSRSQPLACSSHQVDNLCLKTLGEARKEQLAARTRSERERAAKRLRTRKDKLMNDEKEHRRTSLEISSVIEPRNLLLEDVTYLATCPIPIRSGTTESRSKKSDSKPSTEENCNTLVMLDEVWTNSEEINFFLRDYFFQEVAIITRFSYRRLALATLNNQFYDALDSILSYIEKERMVASYLYPYSVFRSAPERSRGAGGYGIKRMGGFLKLPPMVVEICLDTCGLKAYEALVLYDTTWTELQVFPSTISSRLVSVETWRINLWIPMDGSFASKKQQIKELANKHLEEVQSVVSKSKLFSLDLVSRRATIVYRVIKAQSKEQELGSGDWERDYKLPTGFPNFTRIRGRGSVLPPSRLDSKEGLEEKLVYEEAPGLFETSFAFGNFRVENVVPIPGLTSRCSPER